jgi:prefoldin subunit 5
MASADELKEIQSLTSSISKMMDSISDKSDKRNRALEREAKIMKSIASEISDVEDINKGIEGLERRRSQIQKSSFGVNQKLKGDLLKMNQISIDSLNAESRKLEVLQRVNQISSDIGTNLSNSIDSFKSKIEEVPVLGKAIAKIIPTKKLNAAIDGATAGFQRGFGTMFKRSLSQGKGFLKSFGSGMSAGLGQIGKSLAPLLANPFVLAGVVIAAFLGAGVIAFYKIEKAAKAFRNETGLLNSQTQQTEKNINNVYQSTVGLGASMEDVAQAAADFTNEFGGIEQPMESTLQSMVVLSKNFGVSTKDAAAVNKAFQNMSGLSESAAQSQVMFTAELARAAGVAPTKVMADIAESANDAGGFFRGNTTEMIKTAAYARAMGSSLKEVAAISRGLLDYQSSVTNEMEASAILGTNLNFSQSRYLAAQGDILGAQKSMVEQLRNTVDLENASIYEREALEKATGMQFDQIQNMARIQERFGDLDGERLAAAQALVAQGKDAKNLTEDDLKAQIKTMETQKETQGVLESIGNSFSAVGSKLLQAFLPIGQAIASMLEDAMPYFDMMGDILSKSVKPAVFVVSTIFKGIGKTIGAFIDALKPGFQSMLDALKPIRDIFSKIFSSSGESGKFMQIIMRVFSFVGNIVGTVLGTAFKAIGNVITHIANTFGYIIDFFKGDIGFGEMVSGILGSMVEMVGNIVTTLWEGIKSVFSSLGTYIYDQVKDSLGFIGSWFGGDDSETTENVSPPADLSVQEIEAGNYKDNPIMAKAVSPIAETEMGTIAQMAASGDIVGATTAANASNIDMSAVVNAIKELTSVSSSNKDVYIDNEKITSRISKTQEKSNINQFGLMGA